MHTPTHTRVHKHVHFYHLQSASSALLCFSLGVKAMFFIKIISLKHNAHDSNTCFTISTYLKRLTLRGHILKPSL